ncbi:MAG: hypothetical protein ACRC76_02585 [Proteocatella sp.]
MKKAAVLVMIMTLVSKTLGFGRDVILSYFYGASYISDAYLISQTIPNVLFGFIGTAIVTAYIPMESNIQRFFADKGRFFDSSFYGDSV